VLLLGWMSVSGAAADEPTAESNASEASTRQQLEKLWNDRGLALVQTYCIDCHNADYQEAELDLESHATVAAMQETREHWEKVLQRVRFGSMPPEDAAQPTDDERAELILAIESVLYGSACDLDPRPGKVTVRRLNRAEYNNTIRDIFGQDLRPADQFPSDEVGAGFDNNGDVLSLPPMLFEKYMAAAEEVAARVILDDEDVERIRVERSGDTLHSMGERKVGSFYKFYMREDGVVWAAFDIATPGEYDLRIAGSAGAEGEKVRLGIYTGDGRLIDTVTLEYRDGGGSDAQRVRTELEPGTRRIFVALVDLEGDVPQQLAAADELTPEAIEKAKWQEGKPLEVDRKFDREPIAFAVKSVTLSGPRGIDDSLYPPRHHQLIASRPGKKRSVADAARPGLRWLLRRAFRRPVDEETLEAYVDLVELAKKRGESFEKSMRVAVAAVLVSPRFLFRIELPPGDYEAGETVPLSDHQLATRLAYFLWSSTPDETLLELADQGKLSEDAVLDEQIARMLADPRSEALADNFAAQWLGLRNLQTVQPDQTQFEAFDDKLREAMRQETRLLFLDVVRNNRSILDLLDTEETFLNQTLASHYGVEGVTGEAFRKVSLADTQRRGILTHASILTLTSNPTRTSPVKRGKWILENVLGTPPPEPPPGVPELEETGEANEGASLREQLEIHRADPACASCHRTMDALGFGFEKYNVIGGYREQDGPHEIDASGELPGGFAFDGPLELIRILREHNGEQFARTVAERMLTFALGRELRFEDRCVVDDIVRKAADDEYRFTTLVREIVFSPAFRLQQAEGA
jgi:hypothetical protein